MQFILFSQCSLLDAHGNNWKQRRRSYHCCFLNWELSRLSQSLLVYYLTMSSNGFLPRSFQLKVIFEKCRQISKDHWNTWAEAYKVLRRNLWIGNIGNQKYQQILGHRQEPGSWSFVSSGKIFIYFRQWLADSLHDNPFWFSRNPYARQLVLLK